MPGSLRPKIDRRRAALASEIGPGDPQPYESNETTHFSVMDREGNVVSNTYTINFSYGTGIVAAGTGILLNNEMDDFSAKSGVPNAYGLIGGAANAIEPAKRPLSSMTPTILFKDGRPFLATGSPGGSRIITTVLQIIMNLVDHGMNVAAATAAPRVHHQWLPDELRVERGLSPDTPSGACGPGSQGGGQERHGQYPVDPARRAGVFRRLRPAPAGRLDLGLLVPRSGNSDPFHRIDFARRQGACCAVVRVPQAVRNTAGGQKRPAFGGAYRVAGCVAALARCAASRCAPRLPGRSDRRHERGHYFRSSVLGRGRTRRQHAGEFLQHFKIKLTLEGYDQAWQLVARGPAPGREFR